MYRVRKFVRRRRGPVLAGAAIFAALLAGVIVSTYQARLANQRLQQVRSLANAFVFDVHDAVKDLPGSTKARALIVQTGLKYLDGLAATAHGDPQLEAELAAAYLKVGDVQGDATMSNLGDIAKAEVNFEKARLLLSDVVKRDPANYPARSNQVLAAQRVGHAQYARRNLGPALASYQEAERLGDTLLREHPDDAARRLLVQVYQGMALAYRDMGNPKQAIAVGEKALPLLQNGGAADGADKERDLLLASVLSGIGTCRAQIGQLKEGLAALRRSAALMESLTRKEPRHTDYQRQLLLTWGHIGDMLGNRDLPNLGDTPGAMAAFRKVCDVARKLHEDDPSDARALADYGIALSRLATTIPADQPEQKLPVLRDSKRLLREAVNVSPHNNDFRVFLSYAELGVGDALQTMGHAGEAVAAWHEAEAIADGLLSSKLTAPVLLLMQACRKQGVEAAARGDRAAGLAFAEKAWAVSDPEGKPAMERKSSVQGFMTPRGQAAMGFVYAQLGRGGRGAQAEKDRTEARTWLARSMESWHKVEKNSRFGAPHRRDQQEVEAAWKSLP